MRQINNKRIARELLQIAKELMAADTYKCPECGTKVLEQTGYCVKCKKKVKKAVDDKVASKFYYVHKNGLVIYSTLSPTKISDVLDKIDNKIDPTENYNYVGKKKGYHVWVWYGLFGTSTTIGKELNKNGFSESVDIKLVK